MEKYARGNLVLLKKADHPITIFDRESMELYVASEDNGTRPISDLFDEAVKVNKKSVSSGQSPTRPRIAVPFQTMARLGLETGWKTPLGRLTINISNNCNLWCEYCYADHGFYHAPRSMMSVETARAIIDAATSYYDPMSIVHFFGGEPLMNIPVIEFSCEYITRLHERGLISAMPKLAATTNGTIMNDRLLALIKKYDINLTVSIDGPKEIHDFVRPALRGSSSFDAVVRSVEMLRDNATKFDIECTYSIHHLKGGVSVMNLMDFFYKQFDASITHIAPSSTPKDASFHLSPCDIVATYSEASEYTIDNVFRGEGPGISFAIGVLKALVAKQRAASYCPAFFDQMSVAVNGDVYPCFMFIGDENFRMGNILRDHFPNEASISVFERYLREFGANPVGREAWYSPLSFGCIAGDYLSASAGNLGSHYFASLTEGVIASTLLALGRHYEDLPGLKVEDLRRWEISE